MAWQALGAGLIGDIFDAALDDARWGDFAGLVGRAARIEHTGVWIADRAGVRDISLAAVWRPFMQSYRERFSRIDPWATSLARAPLETVMLGHEHIREDVLLKTEFFNEFARPGGMFRPMGVRMQLLPGVFSTIGSDLPWSRLTFEETDKPRLRRVVPYVKRALQLRLRWRGSRNGAEVGSAALQAVALPVIVCDATSRVGFANAAAESLTRGGTVIGIDRGGRLRTRVPGETALLHRFIRDAGTGGAGGAMRLTGPDGVPAMLVLVSPLPPRLNDAAVPGQVLVCLRAAKDSAAFTTTMVASLFGLSRTQAEIALAIFNGEAPETIAAARGVTITTLRTHLAHIFARTGVENQRGLIRLLGAVPPIRPMSMQ